MISEVPKQRSLVAVVLVNQTKRTDENHVFPYQLTSWPVQHAALSASLGSYYLPASLALAALLETQMLLEWPTCQPNGGAVTSTLT